MPGSLGAVSASLHIAPNVLCELLMPAITAMVISAVTAPLLPSAWDIILATVVGGLAAVLFHTDHVAHPKRGMGHVRRHDCGRSFPTYDHDLDAAKYSRHQISRGVYCVGFIHQHSRIY